MEPLFGPSWGVFHADIWNLLVHRYLNIFDLQRMVQLNRSFCRLSKMAHFVQSKRRPGLSDLMGIDREIQLVDVVPHALCCLFDGRVVVFGRKRPKVNVIRYGIMQHDEIAHPSCSQYHHRWSLIILDQKAETVLYEWTSFLDRSGNQRSFDRATALCESRSNRNHLVLANIEWVLIVDVSTGKEVQWFSTTIANPTLDCCDIVGVAMNNRNQLLIPDPSRSCVSVWNPDNGQLITTFGKHGKDLGEFLLPTAVAVNDLTGDMIVTDSLTGTIQVFNTNGQFITRIGYTQTTTMYRTLIPQGVDVDHDGRIYVADMKNGRIQAFEADGRFIHRFGIRCLTSPWQVKMNLSGEIFVIVNILRTRGTEWRLCVY